jgi:hypothetical protein
MKTYKDCKITPFKGGFVWDEIHYGAESDDVFATVEDAKLDIDRYFGAATLCEDEFGGYTGLELMRP